MFTFVIGIIISTLVCFVIGALILLWLVSKIKK